MTDAAQSVVNGMSPSGRTSPYANSGLVTEVRLSDFEHLRAEWGELAGLRFQQQFEELARTQGGEHQIAPAQRVTDFVAGRASSTLPSTSYIPGITPSRLDRWMPAFIADGLRQGLRTFGQRMRGFVTDEAVVVGVEFAHLDAVRIPRNPETLMHPEIEGLFPAGEGAGVRRRQSSRRRSMANASPKPSETTFAEQYATQSQCHRSGLQRRMPCRGLPGIASPLRKKEMIMDARFPIFQIFASATWGGGEQFVADLSRRLLD